MKDNFSAQAQHYVQFRPGYPPELFDFIAALSPAHNNAWDCATGNGQAAVLLAGLFTRVQATDISSKQIELAARKDNIIYSVAPAEGTEFPDDFFDCVTVAQSLHWFNFSAFFAELNRVLKPGGVFAAIGYNLPCIDPAADSFLQYFYTQVVGPYWDAERTYVDLQYNSIPFPYPLLQVPEFRIGYRWNKLQFTGYLQSWSAVQHYINKTGSNPLTECAEYLNEVWKDEEVKEISFPVFCKICKKPAL